MSKTAVQKDLFPSQFGGLWRCLGGGSNLSSLQAYYVPALQTRVINIVRDITTNFRQWVKLTFDKNKKIYTLHDFCLQVKCNDENWIWTNVFKNVTGLQVNFKLWSTLSDFFVDHCLD